MGGRWAIACTGEVCHGAERAEADAFVAKLGEIGMKPFIIQSDVPDKGTFFRVRVGEFVSQDEALAAKGEFEKREHIIAYVTKL